MKDNWISVNDRLPKNNSYVLAIIPKSFDINNIEGFYRPFVSDYDDLNGFFDEVELELCEDDGRYYDSYNKKVSHWQPLPEPPKHK